MARGVRQQKRGKVSLKIRKDDTVLITAGKDKGKTGKVVRTEPKRGRVFVENLNIVKRHTRPTSVKDTSKGSQVGGIVDKEGPIDISNVMLVDPATNKPTRVRIERKDGKRVRISAKTGKGID